MNLLNGNKTYLLALIGIIWAIVGYAIGQLDVPTFTEIVFASLAIAGLRHGVAKLK